MAPVTYLQHASWDDYKRDIVPELFGPSGFQSGVFLFRGCGNSNWNLTSSFDRVFGYLPSDRRLAAWTRLVAAFREACVERGVPTSILQDDTRLLSYGQHHGLPTRLLDWSLSPYVAAFFAFRSSLPVADGSEQVAIWVLDTRSAIWSRELGAEVLSPPALENVRLLNQAGRFTYLRTRDTSLDEYAGGSPDVTDALVQIALPVSEAVRALPDLEMMGVHPEHLFPGVTGLTEAVFLRAQLGALRDD